MSGWQTSFRAGLDLLETYSSSTHCPSQVVHKLDGAVGLIRDCERGTYHATTLSAVAGLRALPVYLVRRVEYESAMRRLNMSEMSIGALQTRFDEDVWYFGDIKHRERGVDYLLRATLCGNRFASRVLIWLAPERATGISVYKDGAREECLRAIRDCDRGRAVELGRMMEAAHVRGGQGFGRPDATMLVSMKPKEQKAMAANNIGYLLLHGAGGVQQDVGEGMRYYEMAVAWGSAAAASNLGFVYYAGAGTVRRDAYKAKQLYELAIERGERNFAPRNLAILLHHGGRGVKADVGEAARWLLVGIREADDIAARAKCRKSLGLLMRSWRMRFVSGTLRTECVATLRGTLDEVGVRGDEIRAEVGRCRNDRGHIGKDVGQSELNSRAKVLEKRRFGG